MAFLNEREKCAGLRCATALRSMVSILRCKFSSINARTRAICQPANAPGLEPLAPELRSISDLRMDDAATSDAFAASRSLSIDVQDPAPPIFEVTRHGEGPHDTGRVITRLSEVIYHGAAAI